MQDVPLRGRKFGSLCGLLVCYTLVESGLKIMNHITSLVVVLNIFLKWIFFFCFSLYCCWAKCHRSKLPLRSRGLYRIKSGNDCSTSVSSLQPPALPMHPVGRGMFSRHESETVILLLMKFPPSLVSVSCDTLWQNGIMNHGVLNVKGVNV